MPAFVFSTLVSKDPRLVFTVIRDMEKYPQFMRDVKSVRILKDAKENTVVSQWNIDVDGTPIEWTQEDSVDDTAMTVVFKSVKGNYQYEGKWQVIPTAGGAKITINAAFDWGVPNFEKYFGSVYEKKAMLSIKSMLIAIKRRVLHG